QLERPLLEQRPTCCRGRERSWRGSRSKGKSGTDFLLILFLLFAQEGHRLVGKWHGEWGPTPTYRNDVRSSIVRIWPELNHSRFRDVSNFCARVLLGPAVLCSAAWMKQL